MPIKSAQLLGGDIGGFAVPDPLGFLDIIGHSGIADSNGVTNPDFGPAHKIDQMLQPAIYRSIAQGGAIHSYHERGNGTNGDGGWARAATEFDRQDMIGGYGQTTVTQTQASGVSSYTVALTAGLAPLEWVVLGQGATTELIQIAATWNAANPVTFQTATTQGHTSGDPIYHALRNAGYLARSSVVLLDTGGNDVPTLGPGAPAATLSSTWQSGVFGTNPGASRGLTPYMHALRFTIAQMRCTAIYKDTHVSVVYGANWNSFNITSFASWPITFSFGGGNNGNYHYTTVAGSTLTFSTAPDFPGGTVNIFNFCYHDGGGAIWDYSVSGATTVAMTSHTAGTVYDDRSVNAVTMNDGVGLATGATTGTCFRITGLNAGVNTITLKATTLNTYGIFLGWGVEATIPPLVLLAQQFRLGGYGTGYGYGVWDTLTGGYIRRTPKTTQTATVAAGAGTVAGSVTVGTAVTVGTTGTTNTAVYPNDTITIGTGTTQETRRIVAVAGTTTLSVDANFVFTHTGEACVIGYQDADFVGGGYANLLDTQGKLSVPGLNGAMASVASEFDQFVQTINFDPIVNPPGQGVAPPAIGTNQSLANDGVHFSDTGAGLVADGVIKKVNTQSRPSRTDLATYVVPNKRSYLPTFGDSYPVGQAAVGGYSQFANGWTNYYPMSTGGVYRTGFYKDSRTRMVTIVGAITNYTGIREDQLPSAAIIIPAGYRPLRLMPLQAWSSMGPVAMEANSDGFIYVTAGFYVLTAPPPTSGGAYIEFTGTWLPEF